MGCKCEARGKYSGIKAHIDAPECEMLMQFADIDLSSIKSLHEITAPLKLARKMGQSIKELLGENPDLLKPRTPEQIAAILAKESEKAALQLAAVKAGQDWKKVDSTKLEQALLKHVK